MDKPEKRRARGANTVGDRDMRAPTVPSDILAKLAAQISFCITHPLPKPKHRN